jgi:CubicO group peptidase (beta-lactamase class C family)
MQRAATGRALGARLAAPALRCTAVSTALLIVACTGIDAGRERDGAGPDSSRRDAPAPAASERPAPIDAADLTALLDSLFAAGMEKEHIPGAAFILVQDGRVVLEKGYGQADVASGRAVLPDRTIFPIASISKVFTATAAMQLVDSGKVELAADVNRYLDSVRVPSTYPQPVTMENLLTHTSGFDELPGRRAQSADELVPLAQFLADRLVRVHAPGEMTSYSSYGVALAGVVVEDVSGEPFAGYLERHIWKPLGMEHTFVSSPPDALRPDLATAYELEEDGRTVAVPYEIYQTPPTSSILSTVADMGRFMIAHLRNGTYGSARILSEAAAMNMHRRHATMHPRVPGWTLGFQEDDTNGRRIIEHGGDIGGFSALMTLLPDEGVGLYVVHHLESTNLRFDVKRAILDRYFPDRRQIIAPVAHPGDAARLARFAGTYRANNWCHTCTGDEGPDVQDFEVEANDDGTIGVWGSRWVEVSPLYFVGTDGRGRIGFAEDASGRIVALTAGSWRVVERIAPQDTGSP